MTTNHTYLYTKLEIAEIQLNRAIKVLVHDGDVISAITLSGAADDIIWKSLENTGEKSQLSEICEEVAELCALTETPFDRTEFIREKYIFRTELKHLKTEFSSEKIPIPIEAATEAIDRCCENYRRLVGRYPTEMPLLEALYNKPA